MTHLPTLVVEAAFAGGASTGTLLHLDDQARGVIGTATLAGGPPWEDITAYVTRVRTRRTANVTSSPLPRYEAGTATVELNNLDRRFDPTNLSGPYVSVGVTQVTPMRAARVRATWLGVTYDLYRGFADDWDLSYNGPNYSQCVLTCTDATKVLANHDRNAVSAVGAGESTGARVNRVLNSASWDAADRLVATGDTVVQATTLAANTWTELLLTGDTEFGECYVDGAGRVVFRNRRAALTELRSTRPAAHFGNHPVGAEHPLTAVNYFDNPSVEVNINRFSPAGLPTPTVTRSNTRAHSGSWSAKATWAGGETFLPSMWVEPPAGVMVAGRTYTWSAWLYVPTGSPDIRVFDVGVNLGEWVSAKDTWVRVTQPFVFTGDASTTHLGFYAIGGGGAGTELYVDDVMVTEGSAVQDYFDGGSTNGEWDGTAHASTSRLLPELPYADVKVDYNAETVANRVRIARVGGSEQLAADDASQQAYLTRTFVRDDLTMTTDATALDYARFVLAMAKDPELRFSTLVIKPQRDPHCLYQQVLGRQLGDRIRITLRPPGGGTITRDVFIRGVEHVVTAEDWTTTWQLQSATTWAYLVLDHATLGVLDQNALAY